MKPSRTRNGFSRQRQERFGLSTLEFVACTIALFGGAWLGALYLGVDVQHLAHTALVESDLLEKVPEEWRPASPEDEIAREELVTFLRQELVALREEITALRTTGATGSPPIGEDGEFDTSGMGRATRAGFSYDSTLAYWNRLGEIVLGEAALQRDAESALSGTSAAHVYALKSRVSRFASESVQAIPDERVDPNVILLGRKLADWYGQGGNLYDQAVRIWELPPNHSSQARHMRLWRQADVQHRNEGQVLSDNAIAVRNELRRRFKADFPAFGRPISTTDLEASPDESPDETPEESPEDDAEA